MSRHASTRTGRSFVFCLVATATSQPWMITSMKRWPAYCPEHIAVEVIADLADGLASGEFGGPQIAGYHVVGQRPDIPLLTRRWCRPLALADSANDSSGGIRRPLRSSAMSKMVLLWHAWLAGSCGLLGAGSWLSWPMGSRPGDQVPEGIVLAVAAAGLAAAGERRGQRLAGRRFAGVLDGQPGRPLARAPRPGRQLVPAGRADGGAMWGGDAGRPAWRLVVRAARGAARLPGGGQPAFPHPAGARQRQLPGAHTRPGPARPRQATAPCNRRSRPHGAVRALAEHDVTVAGSSLSDEEAQALMAEHGLACHSCTACRTACGVRQAGGAGRSGNQACEHTSFACAEIGHQRFHRVIHVAVRDVVTGPGRIPALVGGPVLLSLTLLQRLDLLTTGQPRAYWHARRPRGSRTPPSRGRDLK